MVEQPLLAGKPAAIAGEHTVRTDNAVTRHNNGDGIRTVRGTYCSACSANTKARGELSIGDRGTGLNGLQGVPNCALEWRAAGLNSHIGQRVDIPPKYALRVLMSEVGAAPFSNQ